MEFRLHYRGQLKSDSNKSSKWEHKHQIRQHIHKQMKELWQQKPLKDYQCLLVGKDDETPPRFLRPIKKFIFVPLVNERINLVTELKITLLRPEEPGFIVTQCGDLDNRLKTLLDALRMPKEEEMPKDSMPGEDENPFFCLLEDDNLVTRLAVETDRLLEPVEDTSEVELLIHVHTKVTRATMDNISFGI
ncbi:hypothetical protein [Scytonema sp. NUACC26]|uniref:hypothetical protein n=1 Tax=Scytonema sp. NUACC26 TaxID=3140176 RepID=UPI0034DBAED8